MEGAPRFNKISPESEEYVTTFVLDDPLYAALEEYWGEFDIETGFVAIGGQIPKKRFMSVLAHEMFHVLSGRTALEERDPDLPANWLGIVTHQRVGTHFHSDSYRKNAMSHPRLRWLNEALTEDLTLQFQFEEEGSASYKQERQLLALLLKRGKQPVPMEAFITAYVENYDPKKSLPIPAWKQLTTTINEAYTPGFLLTLDKFIDTHGIDKAIELMKKDWREIVFSGIA